MKKVLALMLVFTMFVGVFAMCADARGSESGLKAGQDNVLDRASDWFATRGKDGVEKKAILAERKAQRASKRATKEAAKQKKIAQKEAAKAKKEAARKMKEMKKSFKK